jgi:AraC-like DNA-binding protein
MTDGEAREAPAAEFASAVLVALAGRALAAEGITAPVPGGDGALLPLAAKRRFLDAVVREHGTGPLLRAALLLPEVASDPGVAALLGASAPEELFERWQRLERFIHSRHRVVVRETAPGRLVAEHTGPPGEPPSPAEHALVLGVLTVLVTMTGALGLRVGTGPEDATVYVGGAFRSPPPSGPGGRWHFSWSRVSAPPPPPAGTGGDPVSRARELIAADPARRWTLARLAEALGTSPRTLQRRLAATGGFGELLASVRTGTAAGLLLHTEHPLGAIGFFCGYADQPHFTRRFRLRTAMTPAAYRAAFALPDRPPGPADPRSR